MFEFSWKSSKRLLADTFLTQKLRSKLCKISNRKKRSNLRKHFLNRENFHGPYFPVFNLGGKHTPDKKQYLDTFYAVNILNGSGTGVFLGILQNFYEHLFH